MICTELSYVVYSCGVFKNQKATSKHPGTPYGV